MKSKVCQHPHSGMRSWGAEAITSLVKAVLNYKFDPPLHQNEKLQASVLAPLQELSGIPQSDIRQRQLDCVMQILHSCGDTLQQGWPLILGIIGALHRDHNAHLEVVVEVAARFGLQTQDLNVSLTAIGLLWNISDNFFQNRQRIKQDLESKTWKAGSRGSEELSPFDELWLCLFRHLGELCVDSRPAVRKSAGQTLFSTISAHGGLLHQNTWHTVLWQVLFPLLENVKKLSSSASTTRDELATGNILIHHSRDTAEKQWAETRVLSLAGVARTFNAKRRVLQQLGDFPRAWSLLLEYIETSALCPNAEVSLAALKSFQEILQIGRDAKDRINDDLDLPQTLLQPPSAEEIQRSGEAGTTPILDAAPDLADISLWTAAWKVWVNIGTNATIPPEKPEARGSGKVYVPSQSFLTALLLTFPPLFQHTKGRFAATDLQQFSRVLHAALSVPVHGDASPFIIPSYPDVTITPLQDASLQAMDCLVKAVHGGPPSLQAMYPALFDQLLTCVTFGVQAPSYGTIQAKAFGSIRGPQVDWVTMNFVPFSEKVLWMIVDLYCGASNHQAVIGAHVLQNIIRMLRLPLGLKYDCPSSSTWLHAVNALFAILSSGLPVARKHASEFKGMWSELASLFEDFLFTKHPSPPTLSMEDFQRDEGIDCKIVHLIRDDILPYASSVPNDFVVRVIDLLNKGSIHSAVSDTFVDTESIRKLREDFAKTCFETLLQFSFVSKKSEEGNITRIAVLSLLQRCQEVVKKYVDDERLSGKCPLPSGTLLVHLCDMHGCTCFCALCLQQMAVGDLNPVCVKGEAFALLYVLELFFTLQASAGRNCISTQSHQHSAAVVEESTPNNVEASVWQQVILLYPALVECTTSPSPQVTRALKDALHEFRDLLAPPSSHLQNGR
ncbi:hypothetical protein C0Q70_15578 [Pomacea canaliculata]|uniref:Mon2 C-terminal domain-containing protein n=1 Tax=Pomacea canaliculata TaxID=400727 RepID=A0A2T7NV85_POMCA|nr:hypothetical protein C0Q70_15578 [Pomacea canaliculata]